MIWIMVAMAIALGQIVSELKKLNCSIKGIGKAIERKDGITCRGLTDGELQAEITESLDRMLVGLERKDKLIGTDMDETKEPKVNLCHNCAGNILTYKLCGGDPGDCEGPYGIMQKEDDDIPQITSPTKAIYGPVDRERPKSMPLPKIDFEISVPGKPKKQRPTSIAACEVCSKIRDECKQGPPNCGGPYFQVDFRKAKEALEGLGNDNP